LTCFVYASANDDDDGQGGQLPIGGLALVNLVEYWGSMSETEAGIGQAIQQHLQNQNLQRGLMQDAINASRYGQPLASSAAQDWNKTGQNFWENAKLSAAQLNLGAAKAQTYGPQGPNDPFELQIAQTHNSPDLSQAQKEDMISKLRDQQTRAAAQIEAQIPIEEANIAGAKAARPDHQFRMSLPGRLSTYLGQAAPYEASSLAGPLEPFVYGAQSLAGDKNPNYNPVESPLARYGRIYTQVINAAMQQGGKLSDSQKADFMNQFLGSDASPSASPSAP
jgi:hypothetical protein